MQRPGTGRGVESQVQLSGFGWAADNQAPLVLLALGEPQAGWATTQSRLTRVRGGLQESTRLRGVVCDVLPQHVLGIARA